MPKIFFYDFNYPELQRDSVYPVGGATVQLHSWIQGFINERWDVGVLVPEDTANSLDPKVKFIESYSLDKGIPKLRWFYYRIPRLISTIRREKPDFIYQGVPGRISIILYFICKLLRIKFILRISNDNLVDERLKEKYSNLLVLMLKYVYKNADFVFCQNYYQKVNLSKIRKNMSVYKIANPYRNNSKKIIDKQSNYIAWLGIFQYQKNLPLLYEIVDKLPNKRFKIAGTSNNALDKETQKALDRLQKCTNVEFVGYLRRDEVVYFLGKASILLNTSHYEGLSNTFLEAFSVGTPVVCPKNVDFDMIISTNNLGYSYTSAEEAIAQIIKCEKNIERYKHNTIEYLRKNHDIDSLTKKMIRIIDV